jgi:hypothetical protein
MRILVALVAALLVGCGGSGSGANPSNTPPATEEPTQSAIQRETVSVEGKGISNSKSFRLNGTYLVQWVATPDSAVGCYHGASLDRVDGTSMFETLANELLDSKAPVSGETFVYNLDDADYYVGVSSGCSWSFTFVPN